MSGYERGWHDAIAAVIRELAKDELHSAGPLTFPVRVQSAASQVRQLVAEGTLAPPDESSTAAALVSAMRIVGEEGDDELIKRQLRRQLAPECVYGCDTPRSRMYECTVKTGNAICPCPCHSSTRTTEP